MVDQRRSDFYVVLTMNICILESKQMLISCYFKSNSCKIRCAKRLTFEYELDILSNTKVSLAKIHGENYMNFKLLLVCHLLCNNLLLFLRTLKQAPLSN